MIGEDFPASIVMSLLSAFTCTNAMKVKMIYRKILNNVTIFIMNGKSIENGKLFMTNDDPFLIHNNIIYFSRMGNAQEFNIWIRARCLDKNVPVVKDC